MKFNFSQHAPSTRAWYTLPTNPSIGKLELVHAGQTNKPYTNAVAKKTAKTGMARRMARGQINAELLAENLKLDRALFPKHVIVGWEGVIDNETGKPCEFTQENCKIFLDALPDWLMKDVSEYAGNPINFMPDDMPDADDFKEQAGE